MDFFKQSSVFESATIAINEANLFLKELSYKKV